MGRRKGNQDIVGAVVGLVFLLLFTIGPAPRSLADLSHKLVESALIIVAGLLAAAVLLVLYRRMKPGLQASLRRSTPTFAPIPEARPRWHAPAPDRESARPPTLPNAAATPTPKPAPLTWNEELIHALEWKRFEELCEGFYREKGWTTKATRLGADGGVDIYLHREGREKPLGVIQCKAWNTYRVGVKPVRELYGVKAAEGAELAVFITSGDYTHEARQFAEGKHLKLLTGRDLLELIRGLPEESRERLLRQTTDGDYTTPTCPSCGIKMELRTAKRGRNQGDKFWGCPNYPRCRQTFQVRKQ